MVKRFFAIISVLVFSASVLAGARADEQKLLKMVPSGASAVISADISPWLELPAVKKRIAESRDLAVFQNTTSLKPADLSAVLLWVNDKNWALLTAWKKSVDPQKLFVPPYFSCSGSRVAGVKVWHVKSKADAKLSGKRKRSGRSKAFQAVLLPGNVMAFCDEAADIAEMLKMMKNSKGVKFPAAANGALRGVLCSGKPPMPEQAWLSCRMTGKNKSDLQGMVSVTMASAEEAAQMCGQAMLMSNILLAGAMQNDPQLAADIVQSLKFKANGKEITLNFTLPASLLERIGKLASEKAKEKKALRKRGKKNNRTPYQGNKTAVIQ